MQGTSSFYGLKGKSEIEGDGKITLQRIRRIAGKYIEDDDN